jgi:hypothetical protein
MLFDFFARITSPGARGDKLRRPGKTRATGVIVAAGIGKWAAAKMTQGMGNELNVLPAAGAKIFRIAAVDPAAAGAATRRIEPIHQPIETISQRSF